MELSKQQLDRYTTLCGKYGKEMAEIMMGIVEDPDKKQAVDPYEEIGKQINSETKKQVEKMKADGTYHPEYQGGGASPLKDARENNVRSFKVGGKLSEDQSNSISDMINQGTKSIISNPGLGQHEAIERDDFLNRVK